MEPTLGRRQFATPSGETDQWSLAVAGDTIVEGSTPPAVGGALRSAIGEADLALTNLEAPISPAGADPIHKIGPTNATAPETPEYLREVGFDAVTLANNHTADYGPAGVERTVEACEAAGLGTAGIRDAGPDGSAALTRQVAGQTVTVLNLCEREFGAAAADTGGTAWVGRPGVEQRIQDAAAAADVLVVVVHAGIEYVPLPPPQLQARLRSFAEAGADLVVGHHPHVPQGSERHAGTPIYYSLGNFRYTRCCRPKTEWGLVLSARFEDDTLAEVRLHPVERRDDAVAFMGERWDPEEFRPYLETASDLVADRERLRAHWQAQAVMVFDQRYSAWLRMAAGSNLLSILRHPLLYLGATGLWDPEERQHQMLLLLNLIRNESHRAVIETTMALRGDRCTDHRTTAVTDRVATLLETTADNPIGERSEETGLVRSLSNYVSTGVSGAHRRLLRRLPTRDA